MWKKWMIRRKDRRVIFKGWTPICRALSNFSKAPFFNAQIIITRSDSPVPVSLEKAVVMAWAPRGTTPLTPSRTGREGGRPWGVFLFTSTAHTARRTTEKRRTAFFNNIGLYPSFFFFFFFFPWCIFFCCFSNFFFLIFFFPYFFFFFLSISFLFDLRDIYSCSIP